MDLSKTMPCPKCGNVVMATDQFCSKCGDRLEPPTFWRRLRAWFQSAFKPGPLRLVLKKRVTLQTIDKQDVKHVYHSMDEVPPEQRAELERLREEAAKELGAERSLAAASAEAPQRGIFVRKNINVFKFKDASGKEQVYHSLEEMPPETRALFEKMRSRLDLGR